MKPHSCLLYENHIPGHCCWNLKPSNKQPWKWGYWHFSTISIPMGRSRHNSLHGAIHVPQWPPTSSWNQTISGQIGFVSRHIWDITSTHTCTSSLVWVHNLMCSRYLQALDQMWVWLDLVTILCNIIMIPASPNYSTTSINTWQLWIKGAKAC